MSQGPDEEAPPARPGINGLAARPWIAGLLLVVVVGVSYAPAGGLGFIYDDQVLLLGAPVPESGDDYVAIFTQRRWPTLPYYRPVAWLTLASQHQLHGLDPTPFHAVNVVLIIAAALLCFALFRRPVFHIPPPAALAGAAVFALHPLASSVVYPIAGRETLLAAVFGLGCVLAFLRGHRIVAGLCFALAVFAKEHAVALIAVLIWADVLGVAPDPPRRDAGRWIERHVLFAFVLLAYILARAAILPAGGLGIAVLSHPLGPFFSMAYALQTSFAPFAGLVYEPPVAVWASPARLGVAALAVAGLVLGVARGWPANRSAVLFFVGFALFALAPSANLLVQESPFAERYVWFAGLGFIGVALVALPGLGLGRWLAPAAALLVIACAVASFGRAQAWGDDETFLTRWLETNPESLQAWIALGGHYQKQGEAKQAIDHYERALALAPDSALAHAALGEVLLSQRRPKAAQEHVERAIRLDRGNHQYQNLLGVTLARQGNRVRAISAYRRALESYPGFAQAHNNLGSVLLQDARPEEARRHFERAVQLLPGYAAAHVNLAGLLVAEGEPALAIAHYRRALELQPRFRMALLGLSGTLAQVEDPALRDPAEALRLAHRAVDGMRRPNAAAFEAVATAHDAAGNTKAALQWQTRALRVAPEARRDAVAAELERYRQRTHPDASTPAPQ